MKKGRLKKIIIFSAVSLFVLYFGGGMAAAFIVNGNVFARHEEQTNELVKSRKNYALLDRREELSIVSGQNTLRAYFYKATSSKGTVIAAHGLSGRADGPDAAYQAWFLEEGYSVCAIDLTASGASEGASINGLHQSAYDVKAAYDYLAKNEKLEKKVFLCGHSWGGYGVAACLGLGVKADAVITFSAFDNPFDTMVQYAERYVGPLAKMSLPPFYLAQNMAYGQEVFRSASSALKESSTKALIIHGEEDGSIPLDSISLFAKAKGLSNVETITLPNIGHSHPWLSLEAHRYYGALAEEYEKLKNEGDALKIEAFLDAVDLDRSSELNGALFTEIRQFLEDI